MQKVSFFCLVLVLSACTHKTVLESPLRPIEPAEFWKDQASRRSVASSFTGKLKMGYEGKRQSISGKGRIVGQQPGSYRLELRDPIGRLHYVLTAQQEELVGYYPRLHQAFTDATGGKAYFKKVLGIAVPFSEMVGLFMGTVPGRWEKAKLRKWEWDREVGAFRGEWEQGGEKLTVWVDSGNAAPQTVRWERAGQVIEAQFSEFDGCCNNRKNFFLAYEVKVQIPSEQTSVQISWDSLSRSSQEVPASAFTFQAGPGDKVSEIR